MWSLFEPICFNFQLLSDWFFFAKNSFIATTRRAFQLHSRYLPLWPSCESNDWDCSEYECLWEHLDASHAFSSFVIFATNCPTSNLLWGLAFLLPGDRDERGWTWWRWTSWGCWGTAGCLEPSSDAMLVGTGALGLDILKRHHRYMEHCGLLLLTICPRCFPRHVTDDVIIHSGFPQDFPKPLTGLNAFLYVQATWLQATWIPGIPDL